MSEGCIRIGSWEEREREERARAAKAKELQTVPAPATAASHEPKPIDMSRVDSTPDVVPTIKMPALPDCPPDVQRPEPDASPLPSPFKTALLITAYNRDELLRHSIDSILAQKPERLNVEVVVLDDAASPSTAALCERLPVTYIPTRVLEPDQQPPWRIPGFAFNIGLKQTRSHAIILSCAEMFHVKHTLERLLKVLADDPLALAIPDGKDDNGDCLACLRHGNESVPARIIEQMPALSSKLPFLMGMKRAHIEQIGGYDEDMVGMAFDDDDIVWRLLELGCHYRQARTHAVHLFHDRIPYNTPNQKVMWAYNRHVYLSRRRILCRNKHGRWGLVKTPWDEKP